MADDYLWDKTGEPDPEIERLEKSLEGYRYEKDVQPLAARPRRSRWKLAAAAALFAIGLAVGLRSHESKQPEEAPEPVPQERASWACELEDPSGGGVMCTTTPGKVVVGEWIETTAGQRAHVTVADIGTLTVAENSRLGLLKTGSDEHRMRLERGAIHAVVDAPPRLFIVETPAAEAVDLGCEYTLEVDAKGNGLLQVASGRVALERAGRSVVVPYDAVCRIRANGPGTPVFIDAAPALRSAVDSIDFGARHVRDLKTVVEGARKRDTLTLLHLLPLYEGRERERVYDRMAALVPAPNGVTRAGTLALDKTMIETWIEELRWEAWDDG